MKIIIKTDLFALKIQGQLDTLAQHAPISWNVLKQVAEREHLSYNDFVTCMDSKEMKAEKNEVIMAMVNANILCWITTIAQKGAEM